ncbi:MAG TPA: SDR family oxidoreductase [Gordonia sp. (in: high G+C Gram-positive bacteria)]|uniref:SDR family NAD(P)-dependent oxidoreductase n=1 Tax=unclassified Gordonia (in: high G+C Gram-positive bacteria) TaxID=2657482 RepID=UPI000FB1CCC1|nr:MULTISPECIES: SDR family oxidoreductase [unclassified Gordonia (in: high G+C Gram-positive bacteria)]RUP40082.1 MAG: SDR family oxidoreductase [Gordonia sp. (in: high G+C Gram-positive bacteria)]HNP57200.1 SDR family oxidoreductase [Gordonia sp. (in: high G+C Gram-positive bacteria)]HRC50172.1 SDR family oxidoreductase [Gordonia sp. (in: high G+C Gram-positive bacteria)]
MENGLGGRVAVVAGATRGIGLSVAYALAGAGASLVINGRDADAVAAAVDEITGGGEVEAVGVVGPASEVADEIVATAVRRFGALDVAINCAGVAEPPGSTILTITREQFEEQIDAHLMSAFALTQAAGRLMAEQGSGSIVLTGSAASHGMFGGSGYPAGKGGVNALTLAAAADLKSSGVRVNAVLPGARSRLSTGDDYVRHIEGLHERGILDDGLRDAALDPAPPEYVAPLYVFLAGQMSNGITGQIFSAAGGFIGRYDPAQPSFIAYRDHNDSDPYSLDELAALLG